MIVKCWQVTLLDRWKFLVPHIEVCFQNEWKEKPWKNFVDMDGTEYGRFTHLWRFIIDKGDWIDKNYQLGYAYSCHIWLLEFGMHIYVGDDMSLGIEQHKMDSVELGLKIYMALLCLAAIALAAFPSDFVRIVGETITDEAPYPQVIDRANAPLYTDGMGTSQVTFLNTNISFVHTACTGSMTPTIGCNSTVYIEPITENDTVQISDIIAYTNQFGIVVMHRVVSYDEKQNCWNFKGDALEKQDSMCVAKDRMVYRVIGILYTKGGQK